MIRRFALAALCALLVVASAAASPSDDKLGRLQDKIARANQREGVLTSQISAISTRIRNLEGNVSAAEAKLAPLQAELVVHQRKLDAITDVYRRQALRLEAAQGQYEIVAKRLGRRLILLYQEGRPDVVSVVFSSTSISDAVKQIEYLQDITLNDESIAQRVNEVRIHFAAVKKRTGKIRAIVADEMRTIAAQTAEAQRVRDGLVSTRDALASTRSKESRILAGVRESKQQWLADVAALQAGSAAIAERIRAAGSSSSATPSAAGLIWPVSGVLTSTFGMRWGRMHEGIDIGAPEGTPIYAATGGTVIYAGWEGGYGNLTVIDHGNGLSTAYGHQSQIAVSNGQVVARGQAIGYVGNTGHSFGPHLHFEVRVNGTPVDPLQYL